MTPREHLTRRGIANEADKAGWQEGVGRWVYPIFDIAGTEIAKRGKAYPQQSGGMKYTWIPSKPQNPSSDWYILPETKQAIAAANGTAYLANGEPALLAFRAAQVNNVIATTHGENTVPHTTEEILKELGITRLINIADKDETGLKAAAKWRDYLRDTGIDYSARSWPDNLPDKADANDLWVNLQFDKDAFHTALLATAALILPQPQAKPIPMGNARQEGNESFITALRQALESTGHLTGKIRRDGWAEMLCPFHDDTEASAGFNLESGVVNCFGGCGSKSPKSVAKQINFDYSVFFPKKTRIQKSSIDTKVSKAPKPKKAAPIPMAVGIETITEDTIEDAPLLFPAAHYSWIDQQYIPISWYSALLNLSEGRSAVAVVFLHMHEAFRTGKLNASGFTIKDVVDTLNLPRKSVTAAIETFFDWGFVSILEVIINTIYRPSDTAHKSTVTGRPSKLYRINSDPKITSLLFAEMMDYCITEAIGRKSLVPPTHTMIGDLQAQNLEMAEAKQWAERTEGVSKWAKIRLDAELALWNKSLLQDGCERSYKVDLSKIESSRDARVQLLRAFLAEHNGGIQISNERLAWLLGCNESNLKAIYEDALVFSERRFAEYEPELEDIYKKTYDDLINSAAREESGLPIAMLIKKQSDGKWTGYVFKEAAMFDLFKRNKGNIARLKIRVEQPSFVRMGKLKSGYFCNILRAWMVLAQMLTLLVELEVELEETKETISEEQKEAVVEIAKVLPKPAKKPRMKGTKERSWRTHDNEFLWEQVRIGAHIFTKEAFLPDDLQLSDAVRYLNKHALPAPIRTVTSYFMQDDELSTLIGTLEILGGEKRIGEHAKMGKVEAVVLPPAKPAEPISLDERVETMARALGMKPALVRLILAEQDKRYSTKEAA